MSGSRTVAVIGCGTIGCSFILLYLSHQGNQVVVYDTMPGFEDMLKNKLEQFTGKSPKDTLFDQLHIASDLRGAVSSAEIVHEAGPENVEFKARLWPEIERYAPSNAVFFSSTSGIPASKQCVHMKDPSRLIVCHPYNPPHIMPLLEVVPGPQTSSLTLEWTIQFWNGMGRQPVVLRKECTGFVANRLAFALLREAVHLVKEDIISVEDCDRVVQNSMGPRWAVAGPFKSYHAGGGSGGMDAFLKNIGGTIQEVWQDLGAPNIGEGEQWEQSVSHVCDNVYGTVDTSERDTKTRRILAMTNEE